MREAAVRQPLLQANQTECLPKCPIYSDPPTQANQRCFEPPTSRLQRAAGDEPAVVFSAGLFVCSLSPGGGRGRQGAYERALGVEVEHGRAFPRSQQRSCSVERRLGVGTGSGARQG